MLSFVASWAHRFNSNSYKIISTFDLLVLWMFLLLVISAALTCFNWCFYWSCKGSKGPTSFHRDSGRMSSSLERYTGSNFVGTLIDENVLWRMSFISQCRGNRALLNLQLSWDHASVWFNIFSAWVILQPILSTLHVRIVSKNVPMLVEGIVCNHAPLTQGCLER